MKYVLQDATYSLRVLRKAPGFVVIWLSSLG